MIIGISGKIGSGKDTIGTIIKYLIVEEQRKLNNRESLGRFNPEWVYNTYEEVNFEIKKFADKLKDIVCLLIGCTREQLEDRKFKEKELGEEWWYFKSSMGLYSYKEYKDPMLDLPKSYELIKLNPRKLLQLLGTEAGRDIIHPNIWVNALMSEYKEDTLYDPRSKTGGMGGSNWIITDMRFENELKVVKNKGGITIRVNRDTLSITNLSTLNNKLLTQQNIKDQHPSEKALDNAEFDYTIDNNGTMEELIEKVRQILIKEKII